jgi:uncharacterized protein
MSRSALVAVLAALLVAAAPAAAQTTRADTTPTIAADGAGTATLTPDLASFAIGVNHTARTSRAARDATNGVIAAVTRALKARGVADADIRTADASVTREHLRRKHHKTVTRYLAAQELIVTVRAVAKLGALLDAASDAGADQVGNPDFSFADPSQGRLLATRAALADARKRADDAAAQVGLRITGVRSVDLDPSQSDGEDDSNSSASGGSQKSASTVVSPGTQAFEADVRVVYTATPV